jgi:hypothetical protein
MMAEFIRGLTVQRGGLGRWSRWIRWSEPLGEYQQCAEGYVAMQGGMNSSYSPPK